MCSLGSLTMAGITLNPLEEVTFILRLLLKVTREVREEKGARIQERGVVHDLRAEVDHLVLRAHEDSLEPLMQDQPTPGVLPAQEVERLLCATKLARVVNACSIIDKMYDRCQ